MPNLKTQVLLEEAIEKFNAQEDALKILGWVLLDGVWYSPLGAPMTFKEAVEFVGLRS
jgi:hypothetical protein